MLLIIVYQINKINVNKINVNKIENITNTQLSPTFKMIVVMISSLKTLYAQ